MFKSIWAVPLKARAQVQYQASLLKFWWTQWNWDMVSSEYFGFLLLVTAHNPDKFI